MRAVFGFGKMLAALLVAGSAILVPATPALAATGVFISSNDSRCLDADNSQVPHNGTKVQVWQCTGGNNQVWTWYVDGTIRTPWNLSLCLDEDIAGGTGNGAKAQLWQCNGQLNQQWALAGGTITSKWDSRCLDEDIYGGTHNGTKVQVWDCNGQLNQKWHR
jgi:hypothetical protein